MSPYPDLQTWLDALAKLRFEHLAPSIERVRAVLPKLVNVSQLPPIVTVGGTNGKGSTVAVLEALLTHAGYQVGSLTSPHLLHFCERIRLNRQCVSESRVFAAFQHIARVQDEVPLTYFDYAFLAAVTIFMEASLDVWVLEVGMGGLLDAVNALDANVAVITSIGLDHQAFLGDTREEIGRNKAGIFRKNQIAIVADAACPHTVIDTAQQMGTTLKQLGSDFHYKVENTRWSLTSNGQVWAGLPLPETHVMLSNASAALMAVQALQQQGITVTYSQVVAALVDIQLMGREQIVARAWGTVMLDVAHNRDAIAQLCQRLAQLKKDYTRIVAVFACAEDKLSFIQWQDWQELISEWFVGPFNLPRAASVKAMCQAMPFEKIHSFASVEKAFQAAKVSCAPHDLLVVFGSFFTVAASLQALQEAPCSV